VTYDVETQSRAGRRRLRRVARVCEDLGQRVQLSVFECIVGDRELVLLRQRLLAEIDQKKDSLRLYLVDEASRERAEHYGVKEITDLEGPLIV